MKKLVVLFAMGFAFSAHAKTIVCSEPNMRASNYTVKFDLDRYQSNVTVSSSDWDEQFSAECTQDYGAIELSLTCNVNTSTDSGYTIRLGSIGNQSLAAALTPWSMLGKAKSINLVCTNGF